MSKSRYLSGYLLFLYKNKIKYACGRNGEKMKIERNEKKLRKFQELLSDRIAVGHPVIICADGQMLETSNVLKYSQSLFTGHTVIETLNTVYEKEQVR